MSIVLLLAGILAGWLLGNIIGMAVVVFMFWLRKDSKFIKPSLKAEVWRLRHPIKNARLMFDDVVIHAMQLDDKIFKTMLQHKYRSNQKRINRIQYESENEKKWLSTTMKPFGKVLENTYKSLNVASDYKYTPRRVVYADYDKIWEIER